MVCPLKKVGEEAFAYCKNLKEVIIPEGVLSIGKNAFFQSGIVSVDLPQTLTEINSYAFRYCENLLSIVIPQGIKTIEEYTFQLCTSLSSVSLPDGLTSIGPSAFYGCAALTRIALPDSLTTIADHAFRQAGLLEVTIPEGIEEIELQLSVCALPSEELHCRIPYTQFMPMHSLPAIICMKLIWTM